MLRISVRSHEDFPSGLGYIAGCLRESGHTAAIFIPDLFLMPMARVWRELETFKPDIVGLSAVTRNFMEARRVTGEVKRRFGCPVVMGGPHPTALPRSTLLGLPALDAVIAGEGELPMLALAAQFDKTGGLDFEKIPGAAFIREGRYFENARAEPVADLDSLPYPALDLLNGGAARLGNEKIITSRGCPGQCNFCANICMGRKFRPHSPERVVAEIEHLMKKYGSRFFHILDDCFTADNNRAHRICDLIISKRLKIAWDAAGRVNTLLDESLIVKLKKAGCVRVQLGIETGSQRINDLIGKGTTLEMAEKCCGLLRRHGLEPYTSFIIGNEGETRETIKETIAFSRKLKSTISVFNTLIPFPGTAIFEKYYKDYDRPDTDWTGWSSQWPGRPYEPRQTALSGTTLWLYTLRAWFSYFCSPSQILRILGGAFNWLSISET
ncbi:MAG: hypothetical protein A2081_01625 [Elusimicrobia bacterium GWC2_61_19]|nr:MAG: hypothetical protein A2081_01625 [Elusimicrobia bacterium GWC2_61_19]